MITEVGHNEIVQSETIRLCTPQQPFGLESGETLAEATVVFETYGRLNEDGTNAILICHALTADAHAAGYRQVDDQKPGWWDGLIGEGKALDTSEYFVVCPNILGSCYGTTGPVSTNPKTGMPYRAAFPTITLRDIVRVQKLLLDRLGVQRLATVVGSSLGGMQVLEWGVMYPEFCETIIPISTAAQQPAWCTALNTAARTAIMNDPAWNNGNYEQQPERGLALARMIGMISYRSPAEFDERFGRQLVDNPSLERENYFSVQNYLRYQGNKLAARFDANTYLCLTRAMDLHDIAHNRGTVADVLRSIRARTLSIGVSTDVRYAVVYQQRIAELIPRACYVEIDSIHGHDAFLLEFDQLNAVIGSFLHSA